MRTSAHNGQKGFSLIEVLVAVIIVGLALTVLMQLLSGSMRLSVKSRDLLDHATRADEIFSYILTRDIRDEAFIWDNETETERWTLGLFAVENSQLLAATENLQITPPAELYKLVFSYFASGDRPVVVLEALQRYPVGELTEHFKGQHLSEGEARGSGE